VPKYLSTRPDSPDLGDGAARARESGVPGTAAPGAESRRVRELPSPPKTSDDIGIPYVEADAAPPRGWRRWWICGGRWAPSSCLVSFLFHCIVLLVLALLMRVSVSDRGPEMLTVYTDVPQPPLEFSQDHLDTLIVKPDRRPGSVDVREQGYRVPEVGSPDVGLAAADASRPAAGLQAEEPIDWLLATDADVGGALDGRGRKARAALLRRGGGSPDSQQAVERGLRWLRAHQRTNGSWHFDHRGGLCGGQCRNPGTEASTTAATALALLPLLGAGYTHLDGEYRDPVKRGLYYLGTRALSTPQGVNLQEGTMYAQGLATIALCEAYAMTGDPALRDLAQGALKYIVYAQDYKGGGWRYTPGEPGDTTVTGWQLMALKSGQMGKLEVPAPTIFLVRRFLDGVGYEEGAQYGYLDRQPRRTTTAIGLLCRMYTGWGRNNPALRRGVAYLNEWGPSESNMYYDYYATQVMHHWGGSQWEQWNRKMRDHLVATQATAGHEAGSWYFADRHGDKGGRLYNTAMAVMILEVYYRYMPLYSQEAVAGEF